MESSTPRIEYYSRPGVMVVLHTVQSACWLELHLDAPEFDGVATATVEFLLQPRDERRLARGGPQLLHRQPVPLARLPGTGTSFGRSWLPAVCTPERVGRCHLRVTPATIPPTPRRDSR